MSTGSTHSNDAGCGPNNPGLPLTAVAAMEKGLTDPSPEKMSHPIPTARTPTERKRKRKQPNNDSGGAAGAGAGGGGVGGQQADGRGGAGNAGCGNSSGGKGAKKINDYFDKHTPASPSRQQQQPGGQNSAPGTPTPQGFPSLYHHPVSQGALSPVSGPGSAAGGGSGAEFVPLLAARNKAVKSVQTESKGIKELEDELEKRENRIDELTRMNDELGRQLQAKQKEIDEKSTTITKCLNVVKELLIEKSSIEKKDARAKCMQNRLKLGQFVTQRVGATFQENWTDGFAFQELAKRQEDINNEREEIEKKKRQLTRRKPPSEAGATSRKRSANAAAAAAAAANNANSNSSSSSSSSVGGAGSASVGLHNGTSSADETLFTKPPPRDGMTMQEYYESEEILK